MMQIDKTLVQQIKASGLFDEDWYIETYPDVGKLGLDPVEHYLWLGARLGRDPSPNFCTSAYIKDNSDVANSGMNPFVHYLFTGRFENRPPIKPSGEKNFVNLPPKLVSRRFFDRPAKTRARVIAFHLPQFHAFAENDEWWGKGFTEWANVRPATPQFVGHYQPHIPHSDVGYYNLTSRGAFAKQIELAQAHGIAGFCFYYYWFGGKRLMEQAIEAYLSDSTLDHPFCLCWANENWSRRWDGLESEVLIAQNHSPEDDIACISDLARYIRDPRYIRIDGKPLVLIYRPSLLPSAKDTARRWREWCRSNGIGEIYLAYTQSFEQGDATEFGFDAAIEFPPNNSGPPDLTSRVSPLNPDFTGKVYDWDVFVSRSQNYTDPGYKLFRSVCPGWDNTARRKAGGTCFINNTPDKYQTWLENAVAYTEKRFSNADERIIFVNAWNEWAEGAHLEPDCETGYAYLDATRQAVTAPVHPDDGNGERQVVLVSHDCYRHGAQFLAMNLARVFAEDFGYRVHMIVLGDGPMKADFAKWATIYDLAGVDPQGPEAQSLAQRLFEQGARLAVCNTAVSGRIVPTLNQAGFKTISLIHELANVIRQYGLETTVQAIAAQADQVIFPAAFVADAFEQFATLQPNKRIINPQGLYKHNPKGRSASAKAEARKNLRQRFGLASDAPIVLGVGYADKRKGFDLFIEAGVRLLKQRPDAWFIWVGTPAEPVWMQQAKSAAVEAGVMDRFILPGFDEDTSVYYAGADVFALTSREDPFPSVVLESLDCGMPVIGFAETGGMTNLIRDCGGIVVDPFDVGAYADAILEAIESIPLRAKAAAAGPDAIDRRFMFRRYAQDLLAFDENPIPRVSVIVPNYNYARYIAARLNSIRDQTLPVYELIVLDDKSSDDSVARIRETVASYRIPTIVHANERNSGSVFKQWQLGVEMARGDLVWIAEADDLAKPDFLAELVPPFHNPDVVLSYCQSRQIDGDGLVLSDHYLDYVADIDADRWRRPYVARDLDEIRSALFLKNVIPNVSAVVFRKSALQDVLTRHGAEILSYRNAGDWVAYIRLHECGAIAFNPKSLNDHRRHQSSVTIGNSNQLHLDEIIKVQTETIARFRLGPDASSKAQHYASKVAVQFGLS
jgi:glycosyltransferase involved in cell wall biosynthesis